jgi:transmembrane 9 superfamily member 2/4
MIPKYAWYLTGALLASTLSSADAFYLPGAAPHDYHEGDSVQLLVNALTPMLAGYSNAKIVCILSKCPGRV